MFRCDQDRVAASEEDPENRRERSILNVQHTLTGMHLRCTTGARQSDTTIIYIPAKLSKGKLL
jgi:hypothetical protein